MSVRTAALRRRKMADRSLGRDIGSSHHSSRSLAPASHEVNRTGRTTVSLLLSLFRWCVLGTAPLLLAHTRNHNRAPQAPGCFVVRSRQLRLQSTSKITTPAERFWLAAAPDARQVEAVSRARQPPMTLHRIGALIACCLLTSGLLAGPFALPAHAEGNASTFVAEGNLAKDGTLRVKQRSF